MSHDYKEQLYVNLFDVLNELTEHDSPEVIFDRIVDDFAYSAEYHSGQADVFTEMLNTFRHNNPMETIPDTVSEDTDSPSAADMIEEINEGDLFGGISDINKAYLLEDRDNLLDFIKNVHFSSDSNT